MAGVVNCNEFKLLGTGSGSVSLKSGANPTAHDRVFPSTQGAADTVMVNNGSGVMSDLTLNAFAAAITGAIVFAGRLQTDDTTDASNGTDGSLQTDGGLSVVKKAWIGTTLTVIGNVGIGTSNPGARLHAAFSSSGVDDTVPVAALQLQNLDSTVNNNVAIRFLESNGNAIAMVSALDMTHGSASVSVAGSLAFYTKQISIGGVAIERMRIDSSGKIGMGVAPLANMSAGDLVLEGGSLVLKERITPTADTNYGKLYTKTDNKVYFQDGAGTEHEFGMSTSAAQLDIDQSSVTGAVPVLLLDQADESEEMIEFTSTIGTGNAIEAVAAKSLTTTHFIKATITGVGTVYIPCGTIA